MPENMGNGQNSAQPYNGEGLDLQDQIEAFHDENLC